ncbi:hypothetical protein Patl1_28101 [Pistacia atlantica]|uniref:Uncharacterized protein n=1 Tax=Pistacia atlantica TaxID=434234 RepID=A0ACC1BFP1_9ROSI|nr:hypothetical protein Patl1_28101 [Pistacia atlantica]
MYSNNLKGFLLAVVSSAFIGSSFIIKKKGLRKAGVNGPSSSYGGYGYLLEPLWWIGMVTMIANFVAYIYALAALVTPLGALSIIVSAVLAHFLLEKLQKMGMLGCLLCVVGSVVIVLHAPQEESIDSVMSVKAIGIAIKLTLEGINQAKYFQIWIFARIAITCIITQLNYLNMVSILFIVRVIFRVIVIASG